MSKDPSPNGGNLRADYGIDAPGLVLRFGMIGVAGLLVATGSYWLSYRLGQPQWLRFVCAAGYLTGGSYLATAAIMVWGSRCGKLRLRDKIMSLVSWRGDEHVLDVGCGRGLMLIAAAKRLTTGKALGVDIWQSEDQSGNSRETTLRNAEIEQVADRIEVIDADARKLPFADESFDVVLSSWAIHNIYDPSGREIALREMVRVTKPGAKIIIVDIRHVDEYLRVLQQCGLSDVRKRGPNFLFVIPTHTLIASKPAAE
jgi:arsenite methyltransferase